MKNNIILFSVGVLTASVIGFYFSSKHLPTEKHSPKQERFSPDEEFLFQRSYPFAKFDINAYRKGLAEAHSLLANNRSINSANWTLEGPGNIGGRFNCIAVDPGNASVIYAGSATGGVWKTTDKGQNWAPITDALPFQAIGAIAINPNNHNEIWIGTGDVNISGFVYTGNGIYKSLDGGQSWTNIGLSNTFVISSIIFNPNKAGEVVIGTMGNPFKKDNNRGLYKTSDGGLNFTNQLFVTDSTGIVDIIQDPNNTSVLYASSFTRIRTQKVSVTAGTENYVYKSLDFGQTWTKLTNGLPNGTLTERIGLAISKSNSNILYAFYSTSNGTKPKLYKTTDAGANWNFVSFGSGFSGDSYGQQGWYFGKIYVNPADPNLVYIPAVDLFYSTDGGVNWDLRTPPWYNYEVHADGHHMQFNSPDDIIYSTDGGLYRTTDGGVTWQDIENICNNQFYAITENPHNQGLYAGGVQDNGTVSGNNSTINNFDRIYGGDGFTITYSPDPELVYAESQYGNIVYNTNFPGGTWNDLSTDQAQSYFWHTPYIISSFNPNVVYVGGDKVQRIANAPSGSFTNISPSLVNPNSTDRVKYITTINESILDKNYLFAGTADGNVWKTTDYGVNWVKINPPAGADYFITRVVPSPNTKNTLYVTRSGYRANDNTPYIFKSTDLGNNWTSVSGDLPALAVNDLIVFPGKEDCLFIANDAGVYYSINGGINWQRLGNNMPFVPVFDIHLTTDKTKILAGTYGRSMYSIDISTVIGMSEYSFTQGISFTIYPNPTQDRISINSKLSIEKTSIYDHTGKWLFTVDGSVADVSRLPVGTYIAVVTGEGKASSKLFVKTGAPH